jgi:hypothetical protein
MTAADTTERWERGWAQVDPESRVTKPPRADAKRFDARFLIDEHRTQSALPALEELRHRLAKSLVPGTRLDAAKVERIIASLS